MAVGPLGERFKMPELPQLSIEQCRTRQQRLRETLTTLQADRAILVSAENVQWLTGFRPHPLMRAVAVLEVDGDCLLVAPGGEPDHHAADRVRTFESQWLCTLRQDQLQAAMRQVPASGQRTACEHSMLGAAVQAEFSSEPIDLDHALWDLRRRKDADELQMIRHAIACTDAMYRRARDIIRPGITELDVYCQLHTAAVLAAGEPLTALGNDFQCNSPGGPPRNRPALAGELMILDLGPAYRGYYADNCRTFSVDGQPTDEQLRAREVVISVFELVAEHVRPGASCRELFERSRQILDEYQPGAFFHHLGHGIGLYPHEAPHLNPNWDDRFAEGDVFTAEPGLYTEHLHAGIRIEENFRVTADGIEQLTSTPTKLSS
jgi:Xaa-Pro dipeptidase